MASSGSTDRDCCSPVRPDSTAVGTSRAACRRLGGRLRAAPGPRPARRGPRCWCCHRSRPPSSWTPLLSPGFPAGGLGSTGVSSPGAPRGSSPPSSASHPRRELSPSGSRHPASSSPPGVRRPSPWRRRWSVSQALDPEHLVLDVAALGVVRVSGQLDVVPVLRVRVAGASLGCTPESRRSRWCCHRRCASPRRAGPSRTACCRPGSGPAARTSGPTVRRPRRSRTPPRRSRRAGAGRCWGGRTRSRRHWSDRGRWVRRTRRASRCRCCRSGRPCRRSRPRACWLSSVSSAPPAD